MIELGGNITLVGFKDLDRGTQTSVKKMVGNYVNKLSDMCNKFETITLHLKNIHETEKSAKYEIHARLIDNGKLYNSSHLDSNLFVALDAVLKKLETELRKNKEMS